MSESMTSLFQIFIKYDTFNLLFLDLQSQTYQVCLIFQNLSFGTQVVQKFVFDTTILQNFIDIMTPTNCITSSYCLDVLSNFLMEDDINVFDALVDNTQLIKTIFQLSHYTIALPNFLQSLAQSLTYFYPQNFHQHSIYSQLCSLLNSYQPSYTIFKALYYLVKIKNQEATLDLVQNYQGFWSKLAQNIENSLLKTHEQVNDLKLYFQILQHTLTYSNDYIAKVFIQYRLYILASQVLYQFTEQEEVVKHVIQFFSNFFQTNYLYKANIENQIIMVLDKLYEIAMSNVIDSQLQAKAIESICNYILNNDGTTLDIFLLKCDVICILICGLDYWNENELIELAVNSLRLVLGLQDDFGQNIYLCKFELYNGKQKLENLMDKVENQNILEMVNDLLNSHLIDQL